MFPQNWKENLSETHIMVKLHTFISVWGKIKWDEKSAKVVIYTKVFPESSNQKWTWQCMCVCKFRGISLSNNDNDDYHIDLNRSTGIENIQRVHMCCFSSVKFNAIFLTFCFGHKWFVACINSHFRVRAHRHKPHCKTICIVRQSHTPKISCKNAFANASNSWQSFFFTAFVRFIGWSAIVLSLYSEVNVCTIFYVPAGAEIMFAANSAVGNNSMGDCVKMVRKYYALELATPQSVCSPLHYYDCWMKWIRPCFFSFSSLCMCVGCCWFFFALQ